MPADEKKAPDAMHFRSLTLENVRAFASRQLLEFVDSVGVLDALPRGFDHGLASLLFGCEDARAVNEDQLRVADDLDASNQIASCLRLAGDDRNFLARA